jgi:PAS domain S-box-containing protein
VLQRIPVGMPIALVLIGVVLNIAIGQLVRNVLRLPLYLDSIGTILAGALGGPLVGALTGAVSNIAWGLLFHDPAIMPFAITAACIGVAAGIAASIGAFASPLRTAVAGMLTGALAALVSAPIAAHVLQGNSGGGGAAVQEVLRATGANVLQAATLQGFISDPIDKTISFLIVWLIVSLLPARLRYQLEPAGAGHRSFRMRYRYGVAAALSLLAFLTSVIFFPAFGRSVYAVFYIAVVLSAWNGGLGPGLLATGIGAATIVLLPLSAGGGQGLQLDDWLGLCIFLTVSFLIALITDALDTALVRQRRSEAETRSIVDSVVEALLLVAPDRRLVRVNHQFEELFGFAESQVTARRLDELRPMVERVFADPETVVARVGAAVDESDARITDTFVQTWPQERQLELISTPVRGDGVFQGRLFAFRDVTQERELDRMKTEFVSQVSHELRTPLTAIKGFTDLLLDGDAGEMNEEQEEYLQTIQSNVDRLVTLINDLLDVARIESGRVKLNVEALDLLPLVESVVATLHPLILGKSQTLAVDVTPDLPQVNGDKDRVVQVLTNLVSNAYKYTPAGGAIRVEAARVGDLARIAVHDNGIGIAPEDLARLFSRFYRVDSSLTREIGGTGLGLSIVKSIVELHGGTVSVESTPGAGSTFAFTLPIAGIVTADPGIEATTEEAPATPVTASPVK